jgi:hypothetical protein
VPNIVLLNKETHRNLRIQAEPAAHLGDDRRFVQVVITEFVHLVVHYPILFSKDATTGGFYCGAMMGFDEGENLALKDEKGVDPYRPINLQRMPFYVAGSDLAIDLDHPRVGTEKGKPLFDADGNETAYLESVKTSFRYLKPGIEMTRVFIETLMKLNLVEPIDIDVEFDDGSRRDVIGLYTIDQTALRKLPDAAVLELFRRDYFKPIYLMIASLKQIQVLAKKKNSRILHGSAALAGT